MRALDVWYDKIPAGEASAHSDQNRSDYRAFLRALREGRIEALVDD